MYYLFHVDVSKHSDAKMCGINFNCDPFIYIYNMCVCVLHICREVGSATKYSLIIIHIAIILYV